MATAVSSQITNMQNQTALANNAAHKAGKTEKTDDKNMFLTLMLQQLQNQDPTQPTDNTLEQMSQMNTGLANCMNYLSAFYNDSTANSEITQTLSLIGKEVTIKIPKDNSDPESKEKILSGTVSEASFEDGTGKVKINGEYYSIGNIVSVRDKSLENSEV